MKNLTALFFVSVAMSACSVNKTENANPDDDSISSVELPSDMLKSTAIGPLSVLDVDNLKVYETGDTLIRLPEISHALDSAGELYVLKTDSRVTRVKDGIQFKLNNSETKLLKENKSIEGDDFQSYIFQRAMDDIGQWLVMGGYYESMDFVLIDQEDGTETHLWGYPVLSPEKNYFLTSMVDLEAAFLPNGFQLWSVEGKKPVKMYEQELTDWGFDHIIWTNDNKILAQQTYRDQTSGDLKTRLIKMRFIEGLE